MTNFNKGWWNCFNAFAIEILFRTGTGTQNGVHCFLEEVLEHAGVTSSEIEQILKTGTLSDCTAEFLKNYLSYEND